MSYCRSSGDDSDVYLIGTKDCLECFGAGWQMERDLPVHDKFMADSYHNVDANGVRVDDDPDEMWESFGNKEAMAAWREDMDRRHPQPWTLVQEGQYEADKAFTSTSRTEMIAHLERHLAAGHKVPDRAFARLRQEIEEEGDLYA